MTSERRAVLLAFGEIPVPYASRFVARSAVLLDSYRLLLGRELIARGGSAEDEAARLFAAPFVVLSHGTEPDPQLDYANAVALDLWRMPLERLIGMPSRLTAEPANQEARARFMKRTQEAGFATGYEGVRMGATGRRFRIEDATLWNLAAPDGRFAGQAATFGRWTML